MLRNLITSAARMGGRTLTGVRASPQLTVQGNAISKQQPNSFLTIGAGAGIAAVFWAGLDYWCVNQEAQSKCRTIVRLDTTTPEVQKTNKWWSAMKRHPIEGGTVEFCMEPEIVQWPIAAFCQLFSTVHISLPHASLAADFEEICDWLKLQGIDAERSEKGARLGLTQYALKHQNVGVEKHLEKNCGCLLSSIA